MNDPKKDFLSNAMPQQKALGADDVLEQIDDMIAHQKKMLQRLIDESPRLRKRKSLTTVIREAALANGRVQTELAQLVGDEEHTATELRAGAVVALMRSVIPDVLTAAALNVLDDERVAVDDEDALDAAWRSALNDTVNKYSGPLEALRETIDDENPITVKFIAEIVSYMEKCEEGGE